MATYTFSQLKTKLNTLLRDSADSTFTDAEKTEFITEVIENDPYCSIIAQDSSLSTGAVTTVSWTVPSQYDEILDIGVDRDTNGIPEWLDRRAWDQINGTIYLAQRYYGSLPTNKTLYLNGKKRLTTSDNVPDYLAKYILEVALATAFEFLASVLGTRFLKNDITMADLRSKIAAHERRAEIYRSTLPNKRLVVL